MKPFYCENNGRLAIDPVVFFKIYLLAFLYGIRSERQLLRAIELNLAYLDHRTVDEQHNIIIDVYVTPGYMHDSITYISRLDL